MAQTSKPTSGQSGVATCSDMLQELLSLDSDVQLLFGSEAVPGNAYTLSMWSKVIGNALDADNCSSSNSGSSSSATRLLGRNTKHSANISIPMPGTSKQDWLTAMGFVYPVVPQPVVTWDNLEVLLTVGAKYDMPALLSRVGMFLQDNNKKLNGRRDSQHFAWKWIALADKSGLPGVAQDCIDARITDDAVAAACNKELLQGMSPATCCHLADALARHHVAHQQQVVRNLAQREMAPDLCQAYCSTCMATTSFYRSTYVVVCMSCNGRL